MQLEYSRVHVQQCWSACTCVWVWVGHVLGLLATVFTCGSTTNRATKQMPLNVSKPLVASSGAAPFLVATVMATGYSPILNETGGVLGAYQSVNEGRADDYQISTCLQLLLPLQYVAYTKTVTQATANSSVIGNTSFLGGGGVLTH